MCDFRLPFVDEIWMHCGQCHPLLLRATWSEQFLITQFNQNLLSSAHLDMREGVVILPAAERVKLIAGAEEALHHDGIRCCRRHIRRVLAKELEKPCRVGRGLGDIITLLPNPCSIAHFSHSAQHSQLS